MGVPKLLTTLTPYGERKPLRGARAIVDGPALAYHAVSLCLADPALAAARRHPLDQPTYGQLGEAAVAWLDRLREQDVEIQALYFDGYLPEAKRPVRLERAYRTSAQLRDVFAFYQRDNMPGFDAKGPRTGSLLPAPPFVVPAVLDALRASAVYGPLTMVVPGEADAFCAEHARAKGGGTVVTSDSDLLVQDLGPGGAVVLFRDLDLRRAPAAAAAAGKALVVPTYALATTCRKLGLPPGNAEALCAFAFALATDPHQSTSELVQQAGRGAARARHPEAYAAFAAQYAYPQRLADAAKQYDLRGLDPRVSELVLQCCLRRPDGGDVLRPDRDGGILAFAPPLLDSCTRTSAWEVSASIRGCAFSLLQAVAGQPAAAMHEHARMASMATRGSPVARLPVAELGPALAALAALLRRIQAAVHEPAARWAVVAAYQDIQWSRANAKDAVSLGVLGRETPASGVLDRVSWDVVHWLAQIQGTLYSLRILRQTAAFVRRAADGRRLDPALAAALASLEAVLPAMAPPLADYPVLHDLRDLPARLRAAGALHLLGALAELPGGITFRAAKTGARKTRSKGKGKKRKRPADEAVPPSRAATANPFSVLGSVD